MSKKISKHIFGCVFDATNTNRGWRTGIVVHLEAYLDFQIIHIYCHHHVFKRLVINKTKYNKFIVIFLTGEIKKKQTQEKRSRNVSFKFKDSYFFD